MKRKIFVIVATCLLSLSAFALTGAVKDGAGSCQGQSCCCPDCCNHK